MAAMRIFICFLLCAVLGSVKAAWAQNKIATEGEIPIVAWYSVPAEQTSLMRYQELKDSGITYSLTMYPNADALAKALDIAQQAGIKVIASCPEFGKDTQKVVERFKHHPALAGYLLRDEPSASEFPGLAGWAKSIHAMDSAHFLYINLLPNYASAKQFGTPTYQEYVSTFAKEVPVEFLSFDHYPVVDDTLRPEWYQNLEIVSNAARSVGKPFWAFALATPHSHYPVPTLAQLRLEVFSALAYGAQGIQYFTYWTPLEDKNFQDGPMTREGKRTDIYDRVKQVNSEIKGLSGVFLNAKVISVAHAGAQAPLGTKRLDKLPSPVESFSTSGGAVVSLLQKGNSTFLVVVNQDYKQPIKLNVQFQSDVKRVLKDGSLVPVKNHDKTNLAEDPGDIMIWTWGS